ncbi:MAG: hypothetical protein AAFQ02_02680 [Bacteroidota bacterium]
MRTALLTTFSLLLTAFLVSSFTLSSTHVTVADQELMPCPQDTMVSDFVFATTAVIEASGTILSSQTILQNANVTYTSGSGSILSFATGSLTGPSPGFQIFPGSELTINIADCPE